MPQTLSYYLGRQYLAGIALIFGVLCAITFLFDMVELFRRSASIPSIPALTIVGLSLMRLPNLTQQLLPFAVLFGGMYTLARLTRTHEMTVARAAGVSVWQFLAPGIVLAMAIGAFAVTVYNPLGAGLLKRFEQAEAKLFRGQSSLLTLSSNGLWLRHIEDGEKGQIVIHASQIAREGLELNDAIFLFYGPDGQFNRRLDARRATLNNGYWTLNNITETDSDGNFRTVQLIRLPTSLTLNKMEESFTDPEAMSFWDLPAFISRLEEAGFSGLRHRIQWHSLIAQPMMLGAMILLAALFSLRLTRRGGVGLLLAGGLTSGFGLYAFSRFVLALAQSGNIDPLLAVWGPVVAVACIVIWLLILIEDG